MYRDADQVRLTMSEIDHSTVQVDTSAQPKGMRLCTGL